jgi:hypothetical protein
MTFVNLSISFKSVTVVHVPVILWKQSVIFIYKTVYINCPSKYQIPMFTGIYLRAIGNRSHEGVLLPPPMEQLLVMPFDSG